MNQIIKESQLLRKWIAEDFGRDNDRFFEYCIGGSDKRPLYLTHLPIALSFLEVDFIGLSDIENINAGYVYQIASYYAIDAIVDKHKMQYCETEYLELAPDISCLSLASRNRYSKVIQKYVPEKKGKFDELFLQCQLVNSQSINQEIYFRNKPTITFNKKDEFLSMWGRSNPFLFLFEYFDLISTSESLLDKDRSIIKELLYYLQWGDDIGDWREDFNREKWTPFLRKSIRNFNLIPSEKQLEEEIYLSGIYEEEFVNINKNFKKLINELRGVKRKQKLIDFIFTSYQKIEILLNSFNEIKRSNNEE